SIRPSWATSAAFPSASTAGPLLFAPRWSASAAPRPTSRSPGLFPGWKARPLNCGGPSATKSSSPSWTKCRRPPERQRRLREQREVQNVSERVWEKYLSERDRAVYKAAGYGGRIGVGTRPALLIIDVHYSFTGDEPQPILEAVKQYRTACGEEGWQAVAHIKRLLEACRTKNIPTFYT